MKTVVIGGGIIGLASAYYLARRGVDVTVCEKSNIGAGSTERSAGGIRTQFTTPVNVELSVKSLEVWENFEEEFGTEIAYRKSGYLFLARKDETAEQFRRNVEMQNDHGVESEYLEPEEALDVCPELITERFVGATYCARDGFVDPHLALQGFSQACREEGVEIRTKTEVIDTLREDDQVRGVVTSQAGSETKIESDYVVNAAGPWIREMGRLAGVELPIAPKRRSMMVVEPETDMPESVPLTIDLDTGSHFRPEREGKALVGGQFDEDDPDQNPDMYSKSFDTDWAIEALEKASDYAKYFGPSSKIVRGWSGLYAVTPDHHPIVEETLPGLITAGGFSGHGFQHSPATGKIVAELVTEGKTSLVDISPLKSDRFEKGEEIVEKNVA